VKYLALLRLLVAKPVPAPEPLIAAPVVYRGETVLSCGACDLGCPGKPPVKLSPAEAKRCFGVEQGAR
jgi:hypothetical protein